MKKAYNNLMTEAKQLYYEDEFEEATDILWTLLNTEDISKFSKTAIFSTFKKC